MNETGDSTRPSRTELDRLGERIRSEADLGEVDRVMFQQFVEGHDQPMADVATRIRRRTGLQTVSRLKTTGTIVDKLRREGSIRLTQVQDIAGIRLVKDMDLRKQDSLVSELAAEFPEAKIVDRRLNPSHGYRAVHVIVRVDGFSTEIQVRTLLQHLWAEIVERIADRWGRGIRYGEPPDEPDRRFRGEKSRREVMDVVQEASELVADIERARVRHFELSEQLGNLPPASGFAWRYRRLKRKLEKKQVKSEAELQGQQNRMREVLRSLLETFERL